MQDTKFRGQLKVLPIALLSLRKSDPERMQGNGQRGNSHKTLIICAPSPAF